MPLLTALYTVDRRHRHRRHPAARPRRGVCLLPPTLLMGATLPAIARWVETTPEGVSWLGFFYGGNIAGAVIGSLLAGFYLLRVHDMAIATFAAVGLNVLVAVDRAGHRADRAVRAGRSRTRPHGRAARAPGRSTSRSASPG